MATIYKLTDKLTVNIHDMSIQISPLSFHHKMQIQNLVQEGISKQDSSQIIKGTSLAVKYCVKGISGITDAEGDEYALSFGEDGFLTDECVEELLNMEYSTEVAQVCSTLAGKGIPSDQFLDAQGNPIAGVKLVRNLKAVKKVKGKN